MKQGRYTPLLLRGLCIYQAEMLPRMEKEVENDEQNCR